MNTAIAGSVATTVRPTRSARERIAHAFTALGFGRGARRVPDRDELARLHELRREASRLRDERMRDGVYMRLL